jgi:transcription initiation protein SPT3
MTRDEYVHYSDCRQASFTYRKGEPPVFRTPFVPLTPARKFRDYINFPAYLDIKPNDEIVDILGFLSFEMVRSLCITALAVRERMERHALPPVRKTTTVRPGSPVKRKREIGDSPTKRLKADAGGAIVTSPEPVTPAHTGSVGDPSTGRKHTTLVPAQGVSLFAAPPSARQPLLPAHVLEAFAQIQREQAASKTRGMNNFRGGGFGRGKIALV